MWSDYLLIAETLLDGTEHILKTEAEVSTLWQPDRESLTYALREHKELHLLTNLTMVALLCLFEHHEILIEHLLLREADAVKALHLFALSITTPESACDTCQFYCLDRTSRNKVWTLTKVSEITLSVSSDCTILKILVDMLALISLTVSAKRSQCVSL